MGTYLPQEAWKGPSLPESPGTASPPVYSFSCYSPGEARSWGGSVGAGVGCRGEAAFPLHIQQSARPRPSGVTLPRVEIVAEGCRPPRSWEER